MVRPAVASEVRRDRLIIVTAIALLTALAWAYLLTLGARMATVMPAAGTPMASMPGMDMGPGLAGAIAPGVRSWGATGFGLVFLMWAVMMAGMMLPSILPMVWLYAGAVRHAAARGGALAATGWFVTGYLSVWVLFSLAATAGQWTLTRLALLTPMMASGNGLLGGALLLAAGLYQLSPYKRTCLRHCQTPLAFFMQHGGPRPEPTSAMRLGLHHGLYCVGCCALLMTLLFVGGVMNVLWIVGLSVLVLVEKIWQSRWVASLIGAALVAGGMTLLGRLI